MEFLEARIDEEEAELRHAPVPDHSASPPLAAPMRAECAQKREILARWKRASADLFDSTDAQGELAMARRAMLNILAAGYEDHPDFDPEWAATHE
ncbi:DUF6221 family protein [Arthrobacter sp. YAF16]|uniref:DUF6221 family protein n=1 Tax=Arthrobacter sp. YAF16 TaxID=3233076 RepID=UPI003F931155